jgi:chromosome segregation ATPase
MPELQCAACPATELVAQLEDQKAQLEALRAQLERQTPTLDEHGSRLEEHDLRFRVLEGKVDRTLSTVQRQTLLLEGTDRKLDRQQEMVAELLKLAQGARHAG